MIDFEVNREDDAVEVTRLGLSLVNGSFRETARRTVWEGKYTNFLQNAGVRPGENELKVYFMERGDAVVEEMRVLSDSAIVYQPGGMAALRLTPSLSDRDIRVGERFRVDYELRNTGGTTLAAGGEVWVTPLAEGLCVVGSDTKKLGKIAAGKTIRGSFLLRAERPGSLPFELEASSFGGYPIASLAANVTGQPISGDDEPCTTQGASGPLSSDEAGIRKEPLLVAAGALGVVGVLAVVAIALRRWSRATSNASST